MSVLRLLSVNSRARSPGDLNRGSMPRMRKYVAARPTETVRVKISLSNVLSHEDTENHHEFPRMNPNCAQGAILHPGFSAFRNARQYRRWTEEEELSLRQAVARSLHSCINRKYVFY